MNYKLFFCILIFCEYALANSKCADKQYWVEGHHRKAYVRADGTIVSATDVKGHCRSQSRVYEFWKRNFEGISPKSWPHTSEIFKSWTVEEKERVLGALEELPEVLWNDKVIFHRSTKSREWPNPATSSAGVIVLYDESFKKSLNLARVIGHELAHQIYEELTGDQKKDYGFIMNWFSIGNGRYVSRIEGFVQDDGRESPEEDFANNIEFYLFEPDILRKVTPHAYRWIEEHYGDRLKIRKEKSK